VPDKYNHGTIGMGEWPQPAAHTSAAKHGWRLCNHRIPG
jgi:hypothetical protein